jgi:hypothetical protein
MRSSRTKCKDNILAHHGGVEHGGNLSPIYTEEISRYSFEVKDTL